METNDCLSYFSVPNKSGCRCKGEAEAHSSHVTSEIISYFIAPEGAFLCNAF